MAVVLVIGLIAKVVYQGYFPHKLHEEVENFESTSTSEPEVPRVTAREYRQQIEQNRPTQINQNAMCVLNNDTQKCVCIDQKTGLPINLSHSDCIKRSNQETERSRR